MRRLWTGLPALLIALLLALPAMAVNPDEVLDDPALESRARDLSVQIRCLVCQNQSIDDSDAQLARDLRVLVREQLVEGKTDQQVLDFLVERYGEFVLLKPAVNQRTLMLWAAPFALLVIGGIVVFRYTRRRVAVAAPASDLSDAEQAELSRILKSHDRDGDL